MPEVMSLAKINSGLMFRHGQKSVLSLLTIGLSACFELFSTQERATEAQDRSVLGSAWSIGSIDCLDRWQATDITHFVTIREIDSAEPYLAYSEIW